MNELIKKLKDKNYVRAFGLMSDEEQECFKKIKEKNCIKYNGCAGRDAVWMQAYSFCSTDTYAIKPDYETDPDYEDFEIKTFSTKRLGISYRQKCFSNPNSIMIPLHELPSLPNFEEFWTNSGDSERLRRLLLAEHVAREIAQSKTVYARLRR